MRVTSLNSAGKEVFLISDMERLHRFLTLGTMDSCYKVCRTPRSKATEVLDIREWISEEGQVTFLDTLLQLDYKEVLYTLYNTKCKKQEPRVFLLAYCSTYGMHMHPDNEQMKNLALRIRRSAYELLPDICSIPTTLFMFNHYYKSLCNIKYDTKGWNDIHKRSIQSWYNDKEPLQLLYQLTKYKNRFGYTHTDMFRLCHIKADHVDKELIYRYVVKGKIDDTLYVSGESDKNVMEFLKDYKQIQTTDMDESYIAFLVKKHGMSWEHVPSKMLKSVRVWKVLLENMPPIAFLRNINKLTALEIFTKGDDASYYKYVAINKIQSLYDVHPIQLMITLKIYSQGKGMKGKLCWDPDPDIVDALDKAFRDQFNILPNKAINKRVCIAMDVSQSMRGAQVYGAECLNAIEACCAMSMVIKQMNQENTTIMGFSENFIPLDIDPNLRLDDNLRLIENLPFSGTDISLPFQWAKSKNKEFDVFIVMTDNETNANKISPMEALQSYRIKMGIPDCKLVVLATSMTSFTVANPNDKYTLDICGFDSSVPDVIMDFITNTHCD